MTNKDLLKLATMAYTGGHFFGFDSKGNALIDPVVHAPFNPLKNDVDAFLLAVKLKIEIEYSERDSTVYAGKFGEGKWRVDITHETGVAPDLYAATRRAIVLAAAEIGEEGQEVIYNCNHMLENEKETYDWLVDYTNI